MKLARSSAESLVSSFSSKAHICRSCRRSLLNPPRYHYATAAVATSIASSSPPFPQPTSSSSLSNPPVSDRTYTIKAGIILSRPPLLTPSPHPFETAFHLYQRRLNERLVLPFTQYFYYKRATPAFEQFRAARRARNGVASRDIGGYDAYSKEAWNDEVLVGDQSGEKETIVRQLIAEEGRGGEFSGGEQAGEEERVMGGLRRWTEADERGDVRSLERMLERTLYLVVKRKRVEWGRKKEEEEKGEERGGSFWSFPSGELEGKEGLREAAERILNSSCGPNMYTWFVGNHPVGHRVYNSRNQVRSTTTQSDASTTPIERIPAAGEKTFFMKSRIMRGQADPQGNEMGVEDFQWLSKEEIQKVVNPQYWASVKNMLVEQ